MRLVSARILGSTSASLAGLALLGLALGVSGCGPSGSGDDDDDDDDEVDGGSTDDPCDSGATRCAGTSYQECGADGFFAEADHCADACVAELGGCVACRPGDGNACDGNAVYACSDDGSFGTLIEECAGGDICSDGSCSAACGADGSDLVYVVDDSYRLLSFDPRKLDTGADPFTLVGNLDCPAGPALGPLGGPATPFSMSVERDATAWVLYSSGEIFRVSTDDASCQRTEFQVGQTDAMGGVWQLFGMGFVSDAPGSDAEHLYITGGNLDVTVPGRLGTLDTSSLVIAPIEDMEAGSEYSPELTGTGDAELYGYYPGADNTFVAEISKTTAQRGTSWALPGLDGQVQAWAFAHWGGRFYVFVTVADIFSTNSQVLLVDPMNNGQTTTLLDDLPYVIVGAGVSTCAPVFIP